MTKELPVSTQSKGSDGHGSTGAPRSGFVIRHSSFVIRRLRHGYLLLELILALTVFSLSIMGLMKSLQFGIQTGAILSRENDVRLGLRSFLEEVRRKPLREMSQSVADERLGVTFTSEVDELTIKDRNGTVLRDLYKLTAQATYTIGAEERQELVEVWVYKTQTEGRR
jgi:hypothetical protein